jgi:hypothetical protein
MTTSNPSTFSATLFTVVFALIYALVAGTLLFVFQVLGSLRVLHQEFRTLLKAALLGAILPVFLLVLHSIGQLTVRDMLLAAIFFGALYAYFSRTSSKVRT